MVHLDAKSSALVLIDLQKGILSRSLAPRSGEEVLSAGKILADRFRQAGAPVVLVNVAFAKDFADAPPQNVDTPMAGSAADFPPDWSDLVPGLAQDGDIRITKRQWGAFTGTELDLQLRRRGIKTIVLGGVATHVGVESTARHAWELGYDLVIASDATTSMATEPHDMSMKYILPRIARVRTSADIGLT
ncbi:MAG: hydrolase [Bradyrhizobiaceae bacterium]|nr:MAG: hydrolase [Bradyrhizobiaceae bacterium]